MFGLASGVVDLSLVLQVGVMLGWVGWWVVAYDLVLRVGVMLG